MAHILQPSVTMFDRLSSSPTPPTHFINQYGPDKQWFDVSEMGAFMRDLPNFTTPHPIQDYCSEIQYCCIEIKCHTRFDLPLSKGNMIHGLKPLGKLQPGAQPSSIFDSQRVNTFATWGFDPACLLSDFYEPLTQLYVQHGLILLAPQG